MGVSRLLVRLRGHRSRWWMPGLNSVRPPATRQRQRPARRIKAKGSVSDLVADQRR